MPALTVVLFVGANVMNTFWLPPGANDALVGDTAYLVELDTMLVMLSALVPPLLTVTESFFADLTDTVPKLMLVGLTEKSGPPLLAVAKLHVSEYALVPPLFDALTCQ